MGKRASSLLGLVFAMIMLVGVVGPAAAVTSTGQPAAASLADQTTAVDKAFGWLRSQQQPDGSFPASFGSPVALTIDALLAGAAAGVDVSGWSSAPQQPTALAYLAANAAAYATTGGYAGKLIAGVVAAGADPHAFGGLDLVSALQAMNDGAGTFDGTSFGQAWAILGLVAAYEPVPQNALTVLLANQQENGGWESGPGWGTDSNTTALALQALVAAGVPPSHAAILEGVTYLGAQQSPTGGFAYSVVFGDVADANSTALCLQGLIAVGQNPLGVGWQKGGRSALDDLLDLQLPSGAFEWQPGNGADILATVQAIPGVLGHPHPLRGTGIALRKAVQQLHALQQADGGFGGLPASIQALLAVVSIGEDPRLWVGSSGASLLDYLVKQVPSITEAGSLGRLIAALGMANENPFFFRGMNLMAMLRSYYDPATGSYDANGNIWNHALALWGLAACGQEIPAAASQWLIDQRNPDGGWGWAVGQESDSNTTALAMQSLRAAGLASTDAVLVAARAYLLVRQTTDGGFSYDNSLASTPDANSTAYAIQGIMALGEDPSQGWAWARTLTGDDEITITVHKPVERLLRFQLPDGSFEWQTGMGANALATMQAIPVLAEVYFPQRNALFAAAARAIQWMRAQQKADGSFPASFGLPTGITLDVILAAAAAGEDVNTWRTAPNNPSPVEYIATQLVSWNTDAANVGKLIVGVIAAGGDPRAFGGVDLVADLLGYQGAGGVFGDSAMDQAWALLGLAAARGPLQQDAVQALIALQQTDGGWEGGPGWGTDSNTTALALQALRASGVGSSHTAIVEALGYMHAQQAATGGFVYSVAFGSDADANSTAYAVQGLLAAGQDPLGAAWQREGQGPLDDLLSFQLVTGAFEYQPGQGANLMATAQAVPALMLRPNPVRSLPVRVHLTLLFR